MWNPVKELKVQDRYRLLLLHFVESGEGIERRSETLIVMTTFAIQWNPVKELKVYLK